MKLKVVYRGSMPPMVCSEDDEHIFHMCNTWIGSKHPDSPRKASSAAIDRVQMAEKLVKLWNKNHG